MIDGEVVYGILPSFLVGDLDFDNDVNADDLVLVEAGFGDKYSLSDLFNVRNNFGATAASVAAVPEPASLALVGLGAFAMLKRRK